MMRMLIVFSALLVAGCELTDAIDSVNETPKKMDDMQVEMSEMREQIEETNENIRKQAVEIGLRGMFDEENGRVIYPMAFDVFPYAKAFAEHATVEEILEIVYKEFKKLNETVFEPSGATEEEIAAEAAEFNHTKFHHYLALQAMCGFIPQERIEEMVNDWIRREHRHTETGYSVLMLRVQFLRDVLLEASLFAREFTKVGEVEQAIEYADSINYVNGLDFAELISVKMTGPIGEDMDIYESFEQNTALNVWSKIRDKSKAIATVKPEEVRLSAPDRNERLQSALDTINENIRKWGGNP